MLLTILAWVGVYIVVGTIITAAWITHGVYVLTREDPVEHLGDIDPSDMA